MSFTTHDLDGTMVAMAGPTTEQVREAWETIIDAQDEDHAEAWRSILAEKLTQSIEGGKSDISRTIENIKHAQLAITSIQGAFELLKAVLEGKEVQVIPGPAPDGLIGH